MKQLSQFCLLLLVVGFLSACGDGFDMPAPWYGEPAPSPEEPSTNAAPVAHHVEEDK